jgi:MoxR-like ATPase
MTRTLAELADHARTQLGKAVVGQVEAIDAMFLAIVSGGHVLIEGVPGIGKTLAVRTLARVLQLGFRRIQGTADLMPADIIGTSLLQMTSGEFHLHKGPIFTDLLLVDEINRMPPRTQAALLEAMEERQVTIDGARHPLSAHFTVVATQNPIEFEGTYPLPEAELDRFAAKIRIGYPAAQDEEERILLRHHEGFAWDRETADAASIAGTDLAVARSEAAAVRVESALIGYIAALVRRTREWPSLAWGASPRAAIHILLIAKAAAAAAGRDYLLPDDVKRVAAPALRHRLIVTPDAELEGLTSDQVIADVLATVPVPK